MLRPAASLDKMLVERYRKRPSLLEILLQTIESKTSQEKDKVYGLLGLAYDADAFVIEPDYSPDTTLTQMCLRMAEHNMRKINSIDIIFLGGKCWTKRPFPSWCPNFTRISDIPICRDTQNLIAYISRTDDKIRLGQHAAHWNASLTLVPDRMKVTGHMLTIRGYNFGKIRALGAVGGDSNDKIRYSREHAKELWPSADEVIYQELYGLLLLYHPQTTHKFTETMKSTILAMFSDTFDNFLRAELADAGHTQHLQARRVRQWLHVHRTFHRPADPGVDRAVSRSGRRLKEVVHSVEDLVPYLCSIIEEGLRIASTSQSLLWAHSNADLHDEVWLIDGCTMPTILRSITAHDLASRPRYTLVGHAYMATAVMDGSYWRLIRNRGDPMRYIELI